MNIRSNRTRAVPVITYHATRLGTGCYGDDDHATLAEDLRYLQTSGWRVARLHDVVDALLHGRLDTLQRCVAITFDDGTDLDWRDVTHPVHGQQRSLAGIIADFSQQQRANPIHATSFVIAGPGPRLDLDRNCLGGAAWWNEDWWPDAVRASLAIENHSWDHNHDQLCDTPVAPSSRGTFSTVDTWEQCDRQIRQATEYIDRRLQPFHRCSLLAFPYGEYSDYMVQVYLPEYEAQHRIRAAFTTAGGPVHPATSRWTIPRFVCGEHWRTPEEFAAILRDC